MGPSNVVHLPDIPLVNPESPANREPLVDSKEKDAIKKITRVAERQADPSNSTQVTMETTTKLPTPRGSTTVVSRPMFCVEERKDTTYGKEFTNKTPINLELVQGQYNRPRTSRCWGMTNKPEPESFVSTYQDMYTHEHCSVVPRIRDERNTGHRRHNPQPSKRFLLWKFPRESRLPCMTTVDPQERIAEINELERKLYRDDCRSTYQTDYLGLQKGELSSPSPFCLSNLGNVTIMPPPTYSLMSSQRVAYQKPVQKLPLVGNTTRYGCSQLLRHTVIGVVPAVPKHGSLPAKKTEYQDNFGKY